MKVEIGAPTVVVVWTAALVAAAVAGAMVYRSISPGVTVGSGGDEPPQVMPAKEFVLTMVRSKEVFTRSDPLRLWKVDLGTTFSWVRADVTFRYYVPLDPKGWHVKRIGNQFRVIAPAVRPVLPVPFDSASIERHTQSGWARFNKGENLKELEQDMTRILAERARSQRLIDLQRPFAREVAAGFVRDWLLKQAKYSDVKPAQVRVFFSDEPIGQLDSVETGF